MAREDDVLIRQQIELEAVKNTEADRADELEAAIVAAIILLLMKTGYTSLGQMPKRELRALIANVNKMLARQFATFSSTTVRNLKLIMSADLFVTSAIYKNFGKLAASPIDFGAMTPSRRAMWAKLYSPQAIVPGVGLTPTEMLKSFFAATGKNIIGTIKQGYAENWTPKEAIEKIVGTKANKFKDGVMRKMRNQFGTTVQTLIQYVSSYISEFFGKMFSDRYIWISVLDANTTDICRGRNGRIYVYGQGPQPPAHYNCRSKTRPVFAYDQAPTVPSSFFGWIRTQPAPVQDLILGKTAGRDLRAGRTKAEDLPRFVSDRRLTADEYKDTAKTLLT